MALHLIAVGTRMPSWVQAGVAEYGKRMPAELALTWHEIKAEPRTGSTSVAQCLDREAARIVAAMPRRAHAVVLDEVGARCTTQALATHLARWQALGAPVAMVIGGPDGIADSLKHEASESLRLSDLTLPHPIVRVLLAEQLYRAWSINARHPYHRS